MCFYHFIVRYNIFNNYVKEIMENFCWFFKRQLHKIFKLTQTISSATTNLFVFDHFVGLACEIFNQWDVCVWITVKHMKFYIFNFLENHSKDFIHKLHDEGGQWIKKMLLLFLRKLLFGPVGHFCPEYDASLKLKSFPQWKRPRVTWKLSEWFFRMKFWHNWAILVSKMSYSQDCGSALRIFFEIIQNQIRSTSIK